MVCDKTYNRREQFKTHLSKDHEIKDPAIVNLKLEDCLNGRNLYEVSFWCGFCRKMVQVKEKGLKACMWVGRTDHVDDHLKGQNGPKMDMCEWKKPDHSLSEVAITLIGPEEASQHEPSVTISASPTGADHAGRPTKRPADEGAPQIKLPKKARLTDVWYCVGTPISLPCY